MVSVVEFAVTVKLIALQGKMQTLIGTNDNIMSEESTTRFLPDRTLSFPSSNVCH